MYAGPLDNLYIDTFSATDVQPESNPFVPHRATIQECIISCQTFEESWNYRPALTTQWLKGRGRYYR